MTEAISQVVTEAVGVAVSPFPIIAIVLVLFTARARRNASAFVAAWVLALAVVVVAAYLAGDAVGGRGDDAGSGEASWPRIAFGAVFLMLAARSWRGRPQPDDEPTLPAWMAGIEAVTTTRAFGLGILVVALNPKNLVLTAAAGSSLSRLDASAAAEIVALLAFLVIASMTIFGPVIYYVARGSRAEEQLTHAKGWLARHNAVVMTAVLGVIGLTLVAGGLPPLRG